MASATSASRNQSATPGSAAVQPAAQPVVDITAITTHDDFLLELGQILTGQAAVQPVDSLEAALAAMSGARRAQLLVIDARDIENVRAALDQAHEQVPSAVVLVFAEAQAEKQLAAALKGSRVFAVLPMPLDPRKTQAVVEGALTEAVSRRSGTANAATPIGPPRAELSIDSFQPRAEPGRGSRSRPLLLAGAAAAALALAGTTVWYFSQSERPTAAAGSRAPAPPGQADGSAAGSVPTAGQASAQGSGQGSAQAAQQGSEQGSAPVPTAETSIVQGKVDELLEKARLAMKERRFTEPTGDNALLYYRSALAADGGSGEARDGLQRVAAVLAGRFDEAMSSGRLDEAAQTLANFKQATPADPRVAPFEQRLYAAQVTRAINDGNLERATQYVRQAQQSTSIPPEQIARWRTEIARHQEDAKVQRLAGLVGERIRAGALAGSDDSAKAYLLQLQALAPGNASTQRAARELIAADLHKAREAALARNPAEQDRWLNEARAAGLKPAEAAAFQRELAGARQKAAQAENDRLVQLARERMRDGRLTDPPQDSAAYYLGQLQALDAGNAALADASHELAGRLLDRARGATLAGRSPDADLTQARRWGADPKDVTAVQQLQAAKPRGATLDTAALAASLKRLRAPPPDYPQSALTQHLSGSVTVEYTVDTHGEPHDIHVVEATPPGVFDQAAINAVKHWRYAPVKADGAAVDVPGVRTRVRFELPK